MRILLIATLLMIAPSCRTVTKKDLRTKKAKQSSSGLKLFDSGDAYVDVSATGVKAKSFGKDFQVPSFSIKANSSDFVQILRCRRDYRQFIEDAFGQAISEDNLDASGAKSRRRWVWSDAFGNAKYCEVSALRESILPQKENVYQDIAAPNGSFFYVLNPCVSKLRSQKAQDECSYSLAFTDTLSFTGSLSEQFISKAKELSSAESEYDRLTSEIETTVAKLLATKNSCRVQYASDEKKFETEQAWKKLGIVAGATALGGAIGFGTARAAKASKYAPRPWTAAAAGSLLAGVIAASITEASKDKAPMNSACQKILSLEKSIKKLRNEQKAPKSKMIALSKELTTLDSRFRGYDRQIFDSSGARKFLNSDEGQDH